MKNRAAAVLLSCMFLGLVAAGNTTYYLKDNYTGSGNVAFKDASYWVDADGQASGAAGDALDSTADYVMRKNLRQSRGTDYAHFGGASLRIGGNGSSPYFLHYYNEGTSFDKLYLTSGYYACNRGHNFVYNLDADISVDAVGDFKMTLSYTNSTLRITGTVAAESSARLLLGVISPAYAVSKQAGYGIGDDDNWNMFTFAADMSDFRGTLQLDRATDAYLEATHTMWHVGAHFESSQTIPGSIVVPAYDVLSVGESVALNVSSLTLAAGSMLRYAYSGSGFGSISATSSATIAGPIAVDIAEDTFPPNGGRVTLLTVPDGQGADFAAGDFKLADVNNEVYGLRPHLEVEVDDTAHTRSLVIVFQSWLPEEMVTLDISDSNTKECKAATAKSQDSAMTNAAQWSDHALPTDPNKIYAVLPSGSPYGNTGKTLRTMPGTDTTLPGSLIIGKSCQLMLLGPNFTVGKLTLLDGAILAGANASGTFGVDGLVDVPFGSVHLRRHVARELKVSGTLTGGAELVLEGWGSTSSPRGLYSFTGDLSGFTGTVRVTEVSSMSKTSYDDQKGTNQTLRLNSNLGETQLGGKLAVFNPKALTLERCGTLRLDTGSTLNITTNYNRGIYVNGAGRIFVQSLWHTLNVTTRLTVKGTLTKDGAGPLVLGGECVTEGEAPALAIVSNNVVVAGTDSINGLSVQMSEDTWLVRRVNFADETMTRYGIRNMAATPFVLPEDVGKLAIEMDFTGQTAPEDGIDVGIVTVSADAAAAVGAMLPDLPSPFGSMAASVVAIEDTDAHAVTFALRLRPRGTKLFIR